MTDDELDLVETERLIDTLGRRCNHVLVVTERTVEGGEGTQTWWRGGYVGAIGLAHFAAHDIIHNTTARRPRGDDA